MILLEFRETMYNKAFDLLDEACENVKKADEALCEMYDCLESCYNADFENPQEEDEEYPENNYANIENVEVGEINYKQKMRRGMRDGDYMNNMRMRNNMRKGMRGNMRRGMKRMGRYSY